eukprot:TRINITY_DN12210_c0_g1_i1.p2 TRINITY_DN12210_c0_g1~~TRINITY_DN12210_c0_g1_i1.p2  ORF type:complete len:233 (-),score=73.55 TRINITY_DN12210_c0_g1_i1:78-722(-)
MAGKGGPAPSETLMVKGLPADMTNESCQKIFAQYGNVTSAKVLPVALGKTAAAAFVIMATVDEAKWIVENVNGNVPQGLASEIQVIFATPREEKLGGKGGKGKGKGKDSWGGDSWGGMDAMMGMMQSWMGGGDSWGGKGSKDGGKGGGCGYGSWGGGSKGGGGFGGGGFDGGFGGGKGSKDGGKGSKDGGKGGKDAGKGGKDFGKGGKAKGPYW